MRLHAVVAAVVVLGAAGCDGGEAAGTAEPVPVVTASTAVAEAPTTAPATPATPAAPAPTTEPAPVATTPPPPPPAATEPAVTPTAADGLADWLTTIDATPEATGFAARPPDAYRGAVAVGDRTALAAAADEAQSVQELLALIDAVGPPPDGQPLADAWANSLVALAGGLDALAACADQAACDAALATYDAAYAAWQDATAALPVPVG